MLSDEIIKILDALAERVGLVIDWTAENIIPYLEQLGGKYVSYEVTTSVVWLIFGITCLFIGKWLIKKTQCCYAKYKEDKYSWWDVAAIFVGIGAGIAIFIGIIVSMYQIFDIVTCLTFPEKIIIEELKMIYSSMNN